MTTARPEFTHFGFFKTFGVPAALIFLLPIISFFFFRYARDTFDAEARTQILASIAADKSLTPEERAESTEFFSQVPVSSLVNDPNFAANLDATAKFNYLTFAWMIFLSGLSIVCGAAVLILGGICVVLSLYSQAVQYWSLMLGWQVLRIYGAVQTAIMGVLIVALSFWVTALLFNIYIVKLILLAAILALVAVCVVIKAIFTNPRQQFEVAGKVLEPGTSLAFRDRLKSLCSRLGADPPDHIIAGIDDSFFVTEQPITVESKTYHGKSLFVSLALLKQLNASEADAVLAHEMAHFSGQDTLYSKRISPLLTRFDIYLESLREGGLSLPVFYYMLCFRALFEVSLSKTRRARELRADAIAASATSPRDFATALLRIVAYSKFRQQVENELFDHESALETANVSQRVESGFPTFASALASNPELAESETTHPFDSHPPTSQRIAALQTNLSPAEIQMLLGVSGDGGRRHDITNADDLERQQWEEYEQRFRNLHEQSLAYRFLPSTDAEREQVRQQFPDLSFASKDGELTIDCDTIQMANWPDPLRWSEIVGMTLSDSKQLSVQVNRGLTLNREIRISKFELAQQSAILHVIERYYSRYLTAAAYQKQKAEQVSS